jgi:hypothetical protein
VTEDNEGALLEEARMEDSIEAEQRAYKEAAVMDVPQLAGWALETLGQRITAVGTGLRDARPIREWREGGRIKEENEDRLRLLYRVARTITLLYDQQTARAFLRSASPYLNDIAPVLAIAARDERAVLGALRAFLEG